MEKSKEDEDDAGIVRMELVNTLENNEKLRLPNFKKSVVKQRLTFIQC